MVNYTVHANHDRGPCFRVKTLPHKRWKCKVLLKGAYPLTKIHINKYEKKRVKKLKLKFISNRKHVF